MSMGYTHLLNYTGMLHDKSAVVVGLVEI